MRRIHVKNGRNREPSAYNSLGHVLPHLAVVPVEEVPVYAHAAVVTVDEVLAAADPAEPAVGAVVRPLLVRHPEVAYGAVVLPEGHAAVHAGVPLRTLPGVALPAYDLPYREPVDGVVLRRTGPEVGRHAGRAEDAPVGAVAAVHPPLAAAGHPGRDALVLERRRQDRAVVVADPTAERGPAARRYDVAVPLVVRAGRRRLDGAAGHLDGGVGGRSGGGPGGHGGDRGAVRLVRVGRREVLLSDLRSDLGDGSLAEPGDAVVAPHPAV